MKTLKLLDTKNMTNLRKTFWIVIIMLLIFMTRYFLFYNNPYAGDSYEFKSLYLTNEILDKGYIDTKISLTDDAYKFYTGTIQDELQNSGHAIFLAILAILTKTPIESLRRLSLTTVLLIFPLIAVYQTITKSKKFSLIYVLFSLFFFENALLISGKTANITLAWFITLCCVYLLCNENLKLRSYIVVAFMQIILFFTYKTSAILLVPIIISLAYGRTIKKSFSNKDKGVGAFIRDNIPEIAFTSVIITSFFMYYSYLFPLMIRLFLEKIVGPITQRQLVFTMYSMLLNTLLINIIIFLSFYLFRYLFVKYINILKKSYKYLSLLRLSLLTIYLSSLVLITYIYLNGLRYNPLLITPSTTTQLVMRIIELILFFSFLGFGIIYYKKFLTKKISVLAFFWIFGSIALLPVWFIWGETYGFVLRAIAVIMFPGCLFVTNLIEQNFKVRGIVGKIVFLFLLISIIFPTIYYFSTISTLAKGSVNMAEYSGLKWIGDNIDKDKVIYSDLRIAGAIVPITHYTHLQLKGPNDANGLNSVYEGTNFTEEIENVWFTKEINAKTIQILTYRNVDYMVNSSNYLKEGFQAFNFFYKPIDIQTKEAYDTSIFFDKIYTNNSLWINRKL